MLCLGKWYGPVDTSELSILPSKVPETEAAEAQHNRRPGVPQQAVAHIVVAAKTPARCFAIAEHAGRKLPKK